MSTCNRPIDPLLTAEPDELEGVADTDLGRHVQDCPQCSAAARKILTANSALNALLAESRATDARAIVARARSPERSSVTGWRIRWPAIPPAWGWAAVTAGTLAVWAVLVIFGLRTEPPPDAESTPEIAAVDANPPRVDAPGYSVAVTPTSNPDIVIIWFTKESGDDQVDAIRDGPIAVGTANGL